MKRYISLLILLVILVSITGCRTNESKETINVTRLPTNMESNNTSISSFTYVNEEYGFSLVFPGYWKDQYNAEDVSGVGVRIHHEPTWLKNRGGTLFQVTVFDKSTEYWKTLEVKDNIIDTPAVGVKKIYENDKVVFGLSFPTDVQYASEDEGLYREYMRMENDVSKIAETFKKNN